MAMESRSRTSRFVMVLSVGLFFFLQAQELCSQAQVCSSKDLKALEGFVNGLQSGPIPGWVFASSSSSPVDCCQWTGIRCDSSSSSSLNSARRVVELDLAGSNLMGHVSTSLADLDQLTALYLNNNSLLGVVPPRLFQLQHLRVLDLSNNNLTGSIPADSNLPSILTFNISSNMFTGNPPLLAASTNMSVLDASHNNFSGALDASSMCATSPRIEILYFSSSRLSGGFPMGLGNCTSLKKLSLDTNSITGRLPYDLFTLSSLTELRLQGNLLNGRVGPRIGNLPNLVVLDISVNELSGEVPGAFGNLRSLQYLSVASNKFVGNIPDNFKNLSSLSFLSLAGNSLSNISSTLGVLQHCRNLKALVLSMNFHGERMPSDGIQGFQKLEALATANSSLSGQIPAWLNRCGRLLFVDLSRNQLSGNIPPWFGNLDRLFYLDLSHNLLAGELPLNLKNLKKLIVGGFSPPDSPPEALPVYTQVSDGSIVLQYRKLSHAPFSITLSYNQLTGPIWPQYGELKKLCGLDLSYNSLSGSIPSTLSNMSEIEYLDLSHNKLTGSIPSSLTELTFLRQFSVAYNDLEGPIPTNGQLSTFPIASFEGNLDLCGGQLAPCDSTKPGEKQPTLSHSDNDHDSLAWEIFGLQFEIGVIVGFFPTVIFQLARWGCFGMRKR